MKHRILLSLLAGGLLIGDVSLCFAEIDAANTKVNKRDRNEEAVLPEDQSNKKEYIENTAAIRREIVDNDTLSTSAKNLKIVTLDDGTVVLRGPVNSSAEKDTVETIARKHAPQNRVRSFVEIAQS